MRRREKFLSEARVFKEIGNRWIWDQDHLRSVWPKKPVPDLQDLRILIETALAASLQREEGQVVQFAIVFLPEENKEEDSGAHQEILVLQRMDPEEHKEEDFVP